MTIKKLAPRMPRSIQQWELADGTFGIQQIRQDGVQAQIPGSKLLIFVNEREGDNWWGTSFLRAPYKHWYYKNNFYKIDGMAFERQGMGVPVMKMPDNYTQSDERKAAQLMRNLRANEEAHVIIPQGYEFSFADMSSSTTRDPEKSINHHNKEILISVLAQFLELGQSSNGGSKALSENHSDIFLKGLESIANTIKNEINTNLIKELVDMNFDNVTIYPKLDYSGITTVDVAALGTAYSQLVTAGAINPTDEDQQYLRAAMGLPARSQEDIDEQKEQDEANKEKIQTDLENKKKETIIPNQDETDDGVDAKKKEDENKAKEKIKQEAHEHRQHTRTFDDGSGYKTWRPLTFAEKKVKFEKLETTIDDLEASFTKDAIEALNKSKDAFMKKLHKALDAGDAKTVTELEIAFAAEYKSLIKKTMKDAYEHGKNSVASEMDIPVPPTTASSAASIDLMADTIANKAASDVSANAKMATANSMKPNISALQAAGAIDAAIETAITKTVETTAGLIVGQAMNIGRNDVFQRNTNMIHALQRSEILDSETCSFCLSMDGLIVEPTDVWASYDIFHGNCRGIWVEILKDEEDPPEVTGVPDSLGDYYGGQPNSLLQPPKPILIEGSPAKAEVDRRAEEKKNKNK